MPQIANQDYNVIDFTVLPYYEAIERLYRAYQQDTAFDCVVRNSNDRVGKITSYKEGGEANTASLDFDFRPRAISYIIKAPLATVSGYLIFNGETPIYIVSADGFKLKPVVNDGVLTGVEVTTEKVENTVVAQYFKDWMIGQPIEGGA